MDKLILLAGLIAAAIASSPPSQAQVLANHQARNPALVRLVSGENHGPWLKCADAAGMCGVSAG